MKLKDSTVGDTVAIQKAVTTILKNYFKQEAKLRNKEEKNVIMNFHADVFDIPGFISFISSFDEIDSGAGTRLRSTYNNLVLEITAKEIKKMERNLYYAIYRSGNYNFWQRLVLRHNMRVEPLVIFIPIVSKLQMELTLPLS